MDAGGDDQKLFAFLNGPVNYVIRACHLDRLVEVYNDRLDRWEIEPLQDLVNCVPWLVTTRPPFTTPAQHAWPLLGWFVHRPSAHHPPALVGAGR